MDFKEEYTTERLALADKDGIEAKKIIISEESYLQAEMLEQLIKSIAKLSRRMG